MAQYCKPSSRIHATKIVRIHSAVTVENYTVYTIELSIGLYKWQVKHRYSEFHDLHDKLVSKYKVDKGLLPPKKLFGNQSDTFVKKRQADLEAYLQALLCALPSVPDELARFLHFNTYEIHGIVQSLAESLFHRGDVILQTEEVFNISHLQLHALTTRLKLPEPTCETGDAKKDIGHVLDFVTRVKYAKITGQLQQLGTSNILMNDLNFELNMFKSLETLEISYCNPTKISSVDTIKKTLKNLKVFQTVKYMKDLLLVDAAVGGQWMGTDQEAVLVPVWSVLTAVDFSFNNLTELDQSVKLIPRVEYLNLSHNHLRDVEHLDTLSSLTHLDLSHNGLQHLENLHTRLGNIKTLNLSYNKLQTLQGLSKLYSLENLDVRNNEISQVSDVSPVSGLPCLESLRLNGNPVTIVLDYRTKVLQLFKGRAKEVALDGNKANQKELDTVAILLALQKSKEAMESSRKTMKPKDAHISDPASGSSTSSTPQGTFQRRTPRSQTPSESVGATQSRTPRGGALDATGLQEPTISDLVMSQPGQLSLTPDKHSTDTLGSLEASSEAMSGDRQSPLVISEERGNSGAGQHTAEAESHLQTGKQKSRTPDLVARPKQKKPSPKLGYQFSIYQAIRDAPNVPGGSMLPETLPSRSDTTFMSHLQDLLPNTGALTRMSRTREERREHQEEKTIHVMWCNIISYTQPFRESMACVCITTENLHLLEVKTLRSSSGMPKLIHRNCIPLVNIQQIVLGNDRQYVRIEEAFVGPQGTYTLLTGSMAKTDLFIDSMKQAYRRAISDLDQYEDPHILTNPKTVPNLKQTLNAVERVEDLDAIDIELYILVNAVDYSRSSRPFITHSLVMTSEYLYMLQEDYILWPQATFAIGMPARNQFIMSCAFPIGGKISGIQMYDSDTYSPDQDTSLSQTFSATKSCAMVVPNFIGFGVKLVFDLGALGQQTLDIRVPTSGLRDRFLATLTHLRKKLSERLTTPPKSRHIRSSRLREADTDSLSTNSGGSLHTARHYHKHGSGAKPKHRHSRDKAKFSGARPDLLPDITPLPRPGPSEGTQKSQPEERDTFPYEQISADSNRSSESNTSYQDVSHIVDDDDESTSELDSSDDDCHRLSEREGPTGESDISDSSSLGTVSKPEYDTGSENIPGESDIFSQYCDKDRLLDDSGDLLSSSSELSANDLSMTGDVQRAVYPSITAEHSQDSQPTLVSTNFGRIRPSVSSQETTPVTTSRGLVKPEFSLDVQYPSISLLSHLTECTGDIQLVQPLSDSMRNLASMEADELVNFFHSSVAQIGQTAEELRHILWAPVILYNKQHTELITCIMLSTKAAYFVSDVRPTGTLLPTKDWQTHSRNKSDSYRLLAKGQQDVSDMHLSSGVIHRYKSTTVDQQKVPRAYAVMQLKDLKQVSMGLFDQSFRLVGPTADTTYVCMTRDNKLTGEFTRVLTSLLSAARPTPSPDLPSLHTDPEQDFYSMFNTYTASESHEYKHSSKVAFVYPSEDVISELLFVFSESIQEQKHEKVHHFLAYIMLFSVQSTGSPRHITQGQDMASMAKCTFEPRTLLVTEKHLALGQEDVVHYPIPDYAFGPPAEPRFRLHEVRCIADINRIELDGDDVHIVTLVFAEEPDIVVNAQFDHYSNYGGRVPKHVRPVPEVRYRLAITNLQFKSKLISVLQKQWAELKDDQELKIIDG